MKCEKLELVSFFSSKIFFLSLVQKNHLSLGLNHFCFDAAGMNLKQFNFYSTETSELSFGRKKTDLAWGRKRPSKKEEKKRKKEKREGADIL